jgi:hypothetical protein
MSERAKTLVVERPEQLWRPETRREFLRLLGIGGTVVMLPSMFAACDDDDEPTGTGGGAVALNLGNDTGILNYAYALEQLEAAFYVAVVGSTVFNGMTAEQREVLTDLRNHEVIHREFFRAALGNGRIPDLALNTATVNTAIASAASILKTAETFEDLGVAAYNGAGKYLQNVTFLAAAGSIVAVEARHAAAIRDLREGLGLTGTPAGTRFAGNDVIDDDGLDVKLEPGAVLARVGATNFVTTSISIGTQPANPTPAKDRGPPSPTP